MFGNAKTMPTLVPSKASKKAEITLKSLELYASIEAMERTLAALKLDLDIDLRANALEEHIDAGMLSKQNPKSFNAVEGIATANMQLRKRSSNSALNEGEVALLTEHNISTVTSVSVPECFVINPAYSEDTVLLGKVEAVLKKVPGLPEDFIMKQEGKSKVVVGETAPDEVFKLADKALVEQLIQVVTVQAIGKPAVKDFDKAMELVKPLIAKLFKDGVADKAIKKKVSYLKEVA